MQWITAFSDIFSHSAQAVRRQIRRPDRSVMIEFSRDLAGLAGLAVFVVAWISLINYLGV
ncbi:MAG: hypothetical protein AAF446_11960 [Pseudomonadota bacterium]